MAQREELTLDVKVKGADDVDKLADSFEDVESASEQARKALMQVAQTADAELRERGAGRRGVGQGARPGVDRRRWISTRSSSTCNRMGVDASTRSAAEADQFATTLQQVDDIKLAADDRPGSTR